MALHCCVHRRTRCTVLGNAVCCAVFHVQEMCVCCCSGLSCVCGQMPLEWQADADAPLPWCTGAAFR